MRYAQTAATAATANAYWYICLSNRSQEDMCSIGHTLQQDACDASTTVHLIIMGENLVSSHDMVCQAPQDVQLNNNDNGCSLSANGPCVYPTYDAAVPC